jgi:hypothetical protein
MDAAAGETPHRLLCVVQSNLNGNRAYTIKHFMSSREMRGFLNFTGVLVEIKIVFSLNSSWYSLKVWQHVLFVSSFCLNMDERSSLQ